MAATLATDEIWQAFLGDYAQAEPSITATPTAAIRWAAAAAMATLDVFEEERTLERLPEKIARLGEHLAPLAELPHVGDIRQCGLIAGIELVRDRGHARNLIPRRSGSAAACATWPCGSGVLLRPLGDVIVLWPPLAISLEQLAEIVAAVDCGIAESSRVN